MKTSPAFVAFTSLLLASFVLSPLRGMYLRLDLGSVSSPESSGTHALNETVRIIIQTVEHSDVLHERGEMRLMVRYAVRRINETREDGMPAEVKILRYDSVFAQEAFDPETGAASLRRQSGGEYRLQMTDGDFKPVNRNPVFFELSEPDGSRFYLHAAGSDGKPFGSVAYWQGKEGERLSLEDLGVFVQTDPDGSLRAVRSSTHLGLLEDKASGDVEYRIKRYSGMPSPAGMSPREMFKPQAGATPMVGYRFMKPEQTDETGLLVEVIHPSPRAYRWYRWVENPIGDYDLHYETDDGEVYLQRSKRRYNENRTQFTRVSGRILCGGRRETTTTVSAVSGRSMRVIDREKTVQGSDITWTYSYYMEPQYRHLKYSGKVSCRGGWEVYDYDQRGRRNVIIRPVETRRHTVEYVPDDSGGDASEALDDLLGAFTDGAPAGKRRVSKTVYEYDPPRPPEQIDPGTPRGEVILHDYAHPDPGVNPDERDSRPSVTTRYLHGNFEERIWFTYDYDHDDRRVTKEVTAYNEDSAFDDPRNRIAYR